MSTRKTGPVQRLLDRLGLGTSGGGSRLPYEGCWACFMGRHGQQFDSTCTCCRNNHSGIR